MTRTAAAATLLAAVLALAGCTVSGGEDPPPSVEAAPGGTEPGAEPTTTDPQGEEGLSPEELSAQVLQQASVDLPPAVAGQTVQIPISPGNTTGEVTIEVLSVERLADSTLLRMTMSSTDPDGVKPGRQALSDEGSANLEFFDRFSLEDTTRGVRHLPLSWRRAATNVLDPPAQPVNSCICPYRGSDTTLTPEPILFEALYGPLPEDLTTVALTVPGVVSIPDVPVSASAP